MWSIEQQLPDEINFDIAIEEFASRKARKSYCVENCSFHFRNKDGPNFITFLLFFSIGLFHFCFLFNCYLQCLSFWCVLEHNTFEHLIVL